MHSLAMLLGGERNTEPWPAILAKVLKPTLVAGYHPPWRAISKPRLQNAELPHQT